MTTHSWTGPWANSDDASWRLNGLEYSSKLALAGLVQTTDTGQINWGSSTRPAVGTVAGYEIWRFNDSLQATAPIFIKIEYTMMSTNVMGQWLTVGTGTNGAGTITGYASTRRELWYNSPTSTATAYPSYISCSEGFFGLLFKAGVYISAFGSFWITRYSDASGTPNGDGFEVRCLSSVDGGGHIQKYHACYSIRTAAPAGVIATDHNTAVGGSGQYALWPYSLGGSTVLPTGEFQVVPIWYPTKQHQQSFALCGLMFSEAPLGNTFTVPLKGVSPRTFLSMGSQGGYGGPTAGSGCAMLWE